MGIWQYFTFDLTRGSATFKLTRDSQGASRSPTELQDFRMAFREKRETFAFSPAACWQCSIILTNRAYLRAFMQQALDNLVYYRGDVKLSVQIGTPVLFQYFPPRWSII